MGGGGVRDSLLTMILTPNRDVLPTVEDGGWIFSLLHSHACQIGIRNPERAPLIAQVDAFTMLSPLMKRVVSYHVLENERGIGQKYF